MQKGEQGGREEQEEECSKRGVRRGRGAGQERLENQSMDQEGI